MLRKKNKNEEKYEENQLTSQLDSVVVVYSPVFCGEEWERVGKNTIIVCFLFLNDKIK